LCSCSRDLVLTSPFLQSRGIGKAIIEKLAKLPPPSIIIAASRAGSDLNIHCRRDTEILYKKLDITKPESVNSLAEEIEEKYGKLDVLINNAGITNNASVHNNTGKGQWESPFEVLDVNYYGTKRVSHARISSSSPDLRPDIRSQVCEAVLPLLTKADGRIVCVSSIGSTYSGFSKEVHHRLRNAKSLEELDALAKEYEVCVVDPFASRASFTRPSFDPLESIASDSDPIRESGRSRWSRCSLWLVEGAHERLYGSHCEGEQEAFGQLLLSRVSQSSYTTP